MKGQYICDDKDGYAICAGDTVIDSNGEKFLIEFKKHRELFDCGYVYGFYVPDHCSLLFPPDDPTPSRP